MVGSYALVEEIGRGGQGVIYRAVHCETNEVVALKTLHPKDTGCPESLERFQREALAAQSLDHPYSMPIREIGSSADGLPFFSMKLALGGSLHHLKAKYRGRWRQTAELLIKISKAVHHAHQRGILHRDLKPGNILFTEDHEPLVTDFGLAKHLTGSDDLTQSCAVLGTPNYVSPEQAAGNTRDLTSSSDIYSLGAILFELLTGRPPFVGDNPLDVLRQVAEQTPHKPSRYAPLVPKDLETVCMHCLERRPEDRYASAQDFGDDLSRWLAGRKITQRPRLTRAWRAIRSRGFAGISFGLALGLAIVLCIGWGLAKSSRRQSGEPTTIAVFVEDLNQNGSLKTLARQVTDSLKKGLANTAKFRFPDFEPSTPSRPGDIFDPLAYGRSTSSQAVLTGCVRRSGANAHLAARLLRCDTGEVIWHHTESIPVDQLETTLPTACAAIIKALEERWHSSVADFAHTPQHIPLAEAQTYYTRAMELTTRSTSQDIEEATRFFQQAAKLDSKFVAPRAMLAYSLWTLGESYEEWDKIPLAMSAAHDTLLLDPDSTQAHRVIGFCLLKAGLRDEALEECWSTVEADPQSAGACIALGICLRTMGNPDQAIPWMERAVQLEPARGAMRAILGETLFLCGRDQEGEAKLNAAIHLENDRPDMRFDLGAFRVWQGRFDEAREICAQTCTQFPNNRYGLTLSAWIEFCAGNHWGTAKADFEQLRSRNAYQNNWKFYGAINPASALAQLAKQNGANDQANLLIAEAVTTDRELLRHHVRNPRILHDLAATYSVAGDTVQALHYLQEAIAAGWVEYRSTKIDPRFSGMAALPQFRELARIFPETVP